MVHTLKVNGAVVGNISRFSENVTYSNVEARAERSFTVYFDSTESSKELLDKAETMTGPQDNSTISIENSYGTEIYSTTDYNFLKDCSVTFISDTQQMETVFTWTKADA